MKKKKLALLAISSVAQSDQLDNLIDTSSAIVDQIDRGIAYVGSTSQYSYLGTSMSDLSLIHI